MDIKMPIFKLRLLATLIGLIIYFGPIAPTNAQLPQRCQEIIMQVMSSDGYLTRDMHNEFWDSLEQALPSQADISVFEQYFSENMLYAQEYQLELFTSAQLSLKAGEVLTTNRFEKLAKGANKAGQEDIAAEFLESAGYGSVISRPDGRTLVVIQEVVNSTLPSIASSFARLKRLGTKTWDAS
tara:strand:+ start:123 stop:671 length:549 start_codon:yes stop_codon:yes gene_type:complete